MLVGVLSDWIATGNDDTILIFVRAYPSAIAVVVVVGSWFRWWDTDPTLQLAILLVNAILALSLAAFVADVKPVGIRLLLCALWMLICMGLAVVYAVLQAPATIQRIEREIGGPWFRWLMVGLVLAVGTIVHVFNRINQSVVRDYRDYFPSRDNVQSC